jgi:putative alpha-1,2-mannosidase
MNFVARVHLLQGTDSVREFSTGNTLPIVARPWGLHHWTLQTGASPWTFNRQLRRLWGVRLTHQPSPWMRDYASVLVTPFHGPYQERLEHQSSVYRPEKTVLKPNYLRAVLGRYGITMELAPSERGAILVFQSESEERLRIRFTFDGAHELSRAGGRIAAVTRDHRDEVPKGFGLWLEGEFDCVPEEFEKTADGGFVTFGAGVKRVELRLAGSFVNAATARVSLSRELSGRSLEELESLGGQAWNELLGRIEIEDGDEERLRAFYSCLYRCLLFPRFLDEVDASGKVIHYSPYDGQVHAGPLCADCGFWDTYRTLYPLLELVYPDAMKRMLDGWLNACREGGWTPKWASPGRRDCMIGTHFDVVAADAVVKGIGDWDVSEVFSYLWKDATVPSDSGCYGRRGLEDYIRLGYVPADREPHATSSTLDYAYDDFCVAQVAKALGRKAEEVALRQRAQSYRNVFDSSVGFMRGRLASGEWLPKFDEFEWGGPYIEGGAWQHAFHVPHDVVGLMSLYGGAKPFCRKLDAMLALPPRFSTGSYGYEIHEMTEMASASFGQYAHSNQPVHNFLFLYALAGEPGKTGYWVNRVARELYTPDRLPGDEDNGEMSAWYVWAAMGLYPQCPGRGSYVCFDGVAASAELRIPGQDGILMLGRGAGEVSANRVEVTHAELLKRTSFAEMVREPAISPR